MPLNSASTSDQHCLGIGIAFGSASSSDPGFSETIWLLREAFFLSSLWSSIAHIIRSISVHKLGACVTF